MEAFSTGKIRWGRRGADGVGVSARDDPAPTNRPSPSRRSHEAQYDAHVADVTASRWRVALVDGRWRLARRRPGASWEVLDTNAAGPTEDEDPVVNRYEVMQWLYRELGVRSIVLDRDHRADGVAYDVVVQR